MIFTTRQTAKALENLPVEKNLLVVDENGNEYIIDSIVQRKLHGDDDLEWYYALKIKRTENGWY